MSYLKTKCRRCGASKVSYSPDKSRTICGNCNHSEALSRNKDTMDELKLGADFDFNEMEKGLGGQFTGFVCGGCGAFVASSEGTEWDSCPFCAHEEAEPFRGKLNTIRPAAILPFNFPKAKVITLFKSWAWGLFAPAAYLTAAREPHIEGIYVPFWNFEVMTRSSWKAVQMVDMGKGKSKKQPAKGFFAHFFDDLRLFASDQIRPEAWETMGVFPLEQAVSFDPRYLEGMYTELVQKDIKKVVKEAEKILEKKIRDQIILKEKKMALQNLSVRSEKHLLDARLLLLPVWVATIGKGEELERVLINGFNGSMSSDRPYSILKVAIGVLIAVVGLIGLIILLNNWL